MPLTVLVAGGGIAGLTAALAIGQRGHDVHVFEKSAFSTEIGAALHLGPHACRVLTALGIDVTQMGGCVCEQWRSNDWDRNLLSLKMDLRKNQKAWGVMEDEIMVHRVDLHTALRDKALSLDNVNLHLKSPVEHVDAENGTIILANNDRHTGDVVVGADGIHSKAVHGCVSNAPPPFPVGINIYRFMVQTEHVLKKPSVRAYLESFNYKTTHNSFFKPDSSPKPRVLVCYPCRDGTLLNCASFQTAGEEKTDIGDDYTQPGTVQDILDLFPNWPAEWIEIFNAAEDVKHWRMASRKLIHTFVKDRVVLIGDAAHPTLPGHGAGAGMAIEDGGVLGVLLDQKIKPADVPPRLELFNRLRFTRASTVKAASEFVGAWHDIAKNMGRAMLAEVLSPAMLPDDIEHFMWSVDVLREAEEALASIQR